MPEDNILDLDAINAEMDAAPYPIIPNIAKDVPSKEDLLKELLADIDSQEVEELGINDILFDGIRDERQAEYFIRRYKTLEKERDEINEVADERLKAYREKVEAWRESSLKGLEHTMNYAEAVLKEYARLQLAGKRKRSLKTIEGTIGFTAQQPVFERDDAKLRQYLASVNGGGEFLEPVAPKVKWGELKKAGHLDADGIFRYGNDAVPGVVVTQRPDKFSVK